MFSRHPISIYCKLQSNASITAVVPGKGIRTSSAQKVRSSCDFLRPWLIADWQVTVRGREAWLESLHRGHFGDWKTAGAPPSLYTIKHVDDSPFNGGVWEAISDNRKRRILDVRIIDSLTESFHSCTAIRRENTEQNITRDWIFRFAPHLQRW